jgi:hypothetical protein
MDAKAKAQYDELHAALAAFAHMLDREDANEITAELLAARTDEEFAAVRSTIQHYASFYLR